MFWIGLTGGAFDHVVDHRRDDQQAGVFVRIQLDVAVGWSTG